jgi:hypothetical protein
MWARSVAASKGDHGRWELGIFRIDDPLLSSPEQSYTIQGKQGWTNLMYGIPKNGKKIGVIPAGQAWGWIGNKHDFIEVYSDKQNITIGAEDGTPILTVTGGDDPRGDGA